MGEVCDVKRDGVVFGVHDCLPKGGWFIILCFWAFVFIMGFLQEKNMCHLCSINHFIDDEFDDEFEHDEPSQHECVYGLSHAQTDEHDERGEPVFYPVSVGSSF